ncbi:hypothetical protein P5673_002974 [Acropora cervicornis]|uniref:Uncharacterized protein n=1 Tax=Acropora cervicornis TaxID=6130 RepID=A0AAD9R1V9_ACRCE|nr:hypothetical protein P5673_002974 [Acropora cervicornis]
MRAETFASPIVVLRTDVVKQDSLTKDITAHVQPDLLDNSAKKYQKQNFCGYHCSFDALFSGVGQESASPGKSCKHLLDSGFSLGNGEYWINPGSFATPLKVTCDMTTDGVEARFLSPCGQEFAWDVPATSVENSRYDLLLNSYQSLVVMGVCNRIMLGRFNGETK